MRGLALSAFSIPTPTADQQTHISCWINVRVGCAYVFGFRDDLFVSVCVPVCLCVGVGVCVCVCVCCLTSLAFEFASVLLVDEAGGEGAEEHGGGQAADGRDDARNHVPRQDP